MAVPKHPNWCNRQARELAVTPEPLSRERCLECYGLTVDDLPMVRRLPGQARVAKLRRQAARRQGNRAPAEDGESSADEGLEFDGPGW